MRQITPGELWTFAGLLAGIADDEREATAERIVAEARAADKYRRRFRRAHPFWGCGTLFSALARWPVAASASPGSAAFLAAMAVAIDALRNASPANNRKRFFLHPASCLDKRGRTNLGSAPWLKARSKSPPSIRSGAEFAPKPRLR
ncbi:MAG: hypothetical protein R3D84_13570 [Paracoccaceae bacterium]